MVCAKALTEQYGIKALNLIPTNLYGPGDNFNPDTSHVIPAIMRKMHEAKDSVELWGTGKVTRDFLYVKDAAQAIVEATEYIEAVSTINIGSGSEVTINALASEIAKVVGFTGSITWDHSKPDGQPRRKLDNAKIDACIGWIAKTSFRDGLKETYEYYKGTLGNG
jgi:GDP-L-fucose synthase